MTIDDGWKTSEQAAADLELSVRQALDWFEGKPFDGEVRTYRIDIPDIASIRERLDLSQSQFAQRIGVPVATLRNWEQGRRHPTGPAQVLLNLIDKHPDVLAMISEADRMNSGNPSPVKAAG